MSFRNTYEDGRRAAAYDELEFGGTYHLAFRDLPDMLGPRRLGQRAVDFGCGTGRSTRYLQSLGYETVGVDISAEMVAIARQRDAVGDYRVVADGNLSGLEPGAYTLALSAFTFDNIPTRERKLELFIALRRLLSPEGRLLSIVSRPQIYTHEWVTFTTRDFPENAQASCGDVVRIITTDYSDGRPVEDILWPDADYRSLYDEAGLEVLRMERPLAAGDEGVDWVSETTVAPWTLYLLRAARRG